MRSVGLDVHLDFCEVAIVEDGETTWYEGFLLIGVYALFALAYFFEGPG